MLNPDVISIAVSCGTLSRTKLAKDVFLSNIIAQMRFDLKMSSVLVTRNAKYSIKLN